MRPRGRRKPQAAPGRANSETSIVASAPKAASSSSSESVCMKTPEPCDTRWDTYVQRSRLLEHRLQAARSLSGAGSRPGTGRRRGIASPSREDRASHPQAARSSKVNRGSSCLDPTMSIEVMALSPRARDAVVRGESGYSGPDTSSPPAAYAAVASVGRPNPLRCRRSPRRSHAGRALRVRAPLRAASRRCGAVDGRRRSQR